MFQQVTIEKLERQAAHLSPQEQLKLLSRLFARLSALPLAMPMTNGSKVSLAKRKRAVNDLLALCDQAAAKWKGAFDAVDDIRKMRRAR
jgi:hypothetical protein